MSTITFEDLVEIARKAQPVAIDEAECLICAAAAGVSCREFCDARGQAARDEVADLIGDLPREQLVTVLREAREREARDDEAPGFFWAWLEVDEQAQARGLDCPAGA